MPPSLSLLLTPMDGGTAWRALLAEGEARAGWEAVGPLGLARRVGRLLGAPAEPAPGPERLAAFAARLAAHDDGRRAYSASRAADPFGVAEYLLDLRDRLRAAGWDGGPLEASRRLADLSAIEALVRPGLPELPPGLTDVERDLARRVAAARALPEPLTVTLGAPRGAFTRSQLLLLEALAAAGARVEEAPPDAPRAPDASDLAQLQRALLDPRSPPAERDRPGLARDGSVVVLEADTPAEAGELVAAFCRGRSLASTTLVAAVEGTILDAALARQGLPSIGASGASRWRPALQILPLRLALAFHPRDPLRAAELLLLAVSPLPFHARRALLDALSEMPGLWGPAWNEAVDRAIAEEGRRARDATSVDGADAARSAAAAADAQGRLRERIETWYGGEAFDAQEGIPAAAASAICETVAAWAAAQGGAAEPPDGALLEAAAVARGLQRILAHLDPAARLSRTALEQLHDVAVGGGSAREAFEGEAGRPAVCAAPAAVLPGPAEVIWWGFAGDESGPAPEPWTESERAALADGGLGIAVLGARREMEAWSWRRPVLAASGRLVLVRWRMSGGDAVARHPFHDEIAVRLAPGALDRCAIDSRLALSGDPLPLAPAAWSPAASLRPPAVPLAPRPVWRLPPAALLPAGPLSPSSIEKLFGCPMGWVLEDRAALRPGRVARIPDGSRLLGSFGHALLQDLLLGPDALDLRAATPADAARRAGEAFDGRVESEAAPLVAPGHDVERARARRLVCEAASALFRILQESGWKPIAAEEEIAGELGGTPVHGRVDLLVERGGTPGIIDLKLGNSKHRREQLERGRALQLAVYAAILRRGDGYPPTGYFVLEDGQLLTTSPAAFALATEVAGPSTQETVQRVKEGLAYWWRVLSAGVVPSTREDVPGWEEPVEEAAGEDLPDDGPAAPEPACRFCRFSSLCTMRLVAEGAA